MAELFPTLRCPGCGTRFQTLEARNLHACPTPASLPVPIWRRR